MKYYLAYGSNLNKQQMKWRCPDAVPVGTVTIKDYELVFRGVATIEPRPGAEVQCGIWKISAEDERHLDVYEGYSRALRSQSLIRKPLIRYSASVLRSSAIPMAGVPLIR